MLVPLVLLGIGSVIGGLALNNWIAGWLDPAVGGGGPEETPSLLHFSTVAIVTLVVVALGAGISVWLFGPRRAIPLTQPESRSSDVGWTQRSLRRRAQRSAVHASWAAAHLRTVRVEDVGIDGTVTARRRRLANVISSSSRAERFRPLLRAHHDFGGCDCRRRHPAGPAGVGANRYSVAHHLGAAAGRRCRLADLHRRQVAKQVALARR